MAAGPIHQKRKNRSSKRRKDKVRSKVALGRVLAPLEHEQRQAGAKAKTQRTKMSRVHAFALASLGDAARCAKSRAPGTRTCMRAHHAHAPIPSDVPSSLVLCQMASSSSSAVFASDAPLEIGDCERVVNDMGFPYIHFGHTYYYA